MRFGFAKSVRWCCVEPGWSAGPARTPGASQAPHVSASAFQWATGAGRGSRSPELAPWVVYVQPCFGGSFDAGAGAGPGSQKQRGSLEMRGLGPGGPACLGERAARAPLRAGRGASSSHPSPRAFPQAALLWKRGRPEWVHRCQARACGRREGRQERPACSFFSFLCFSFLCFPVTSPVGLVALFTRTRLPVVTSPSHASAVPAFAQGLLAIPPITTAFTSPVRLPCPLNCTVPRPHFPLATFHHALHVRLGPGRARARGRACARGPTPARRIGATARLAWGPL